MMRAKGTKIRKLGENTSFPVYIQYTLDFIVKTNFYVQDLKSKQNGFL